LEALNLLSKKSGKSMVGQLLMTSSLSDGTISER